MTACMFSVYIQLYSVCVMSANSLLPYQNVSAVFGNLTFAVQYYYDTCAILFAVRK